MASVIRFYVFRFRSWDTFSFFFFSFFWSLGRLWIGSKQVWFLNMISRHCLVTIGLHVSC